MIPEAEAGSVRDSIAGVTVSDPLASFISRL